MKRKCYFFRIIIAFCKFSVTGVVVGLWLVLFFLLLVGGRECRLA